MWKGLSKLDLAYFDELETARAFRVQTDGAWVLLEAHRIKQSKWKLIPEECLSTISITYIWSK